MPDLSALAETAVLALVLVVPGLVVAYLLGLRGIAAVGLAAPISITMITLGGIAAPLLGLSWSVGVLALFLLPTAIVAVVVGRFFARDDRIGPTRRDRRPPQVGAVIGLVVGGASVALSMARSVHSFLSVPAQPDASYHLGQIRHMLQTGDISSLHAGGFLSNLPTGFYPAGFHGVAVTGAQILDAQPIVAANALSGLCGGLVWVSGCILLARQAFGARGTTLAAAGITAASFTAMPFLIAGYGVLWPNLLGMALVPAVLGCVLSIVGRAVDDVVSRARAVTVTLVALPGLFFAHPNSVATLGLVGYVLVFVVTVTWVAQGAWHRPRQAVPAVLALVAPPLLWVAAQSIHRIAIVAQVHDDSPPDETKTRVLTEALLNNPRFGAPIWLTSAFVLVGFVVALRRVRTLWLPVLAVVTWLVFLGVAAYQTNFSQLITGFWYNTSPRLAAITVIPGVLLATLGLMSVSRLIASGLRRPLGPWARGPQVSLAVSAALLVAYLPSTGWNNAAQHQGRLEPFYFPKNPAQMLLTRDGERALQRLAPSIPPGRLVAANPWRGTNLLYAFTGHPVLFPTQTAVLVSPSPIRELVAGELDQAATRPDVCAAVRQLGVTYVITGGTNFMVNRAGLTNYPGIDRVPGRPGFARVAESGPYTLWRITACGL
jgi:hypothetical protein